MFIAGQSAHELVWCAMMLPETCVPGEVPPELKSVPPPRQVPSRGRSLELRITLLEKLPP